MKLEPIKYAGEPEKIIEAALETLGMTFFDLKKIANVEEEQLRQRLRSKDLGSHEWCAICDALYLRPWNAYSDGYMKGAHKYDIREALLDSYYRLPKGRGFWRLMREFLSDVVNGWRFQSNHYGFRLRWKARYQDTMKILKRILERRYRDRNNQEFLREIYGAPKEVVATGLRRQIGRPMVQHESTATI